MVSPEKDHGHTVVLTRDQHRMLQGLVLARQMELAGRDPELAAELEQLAEQLAKECL